MREILFKAKRKDNNEWCFGQLVFDKDKIPFIVEEVKRENQDEVTDLYAISWYEVMPETICEYTGLIDKNGVKIFKNDILQLFDTIGEASDKVTIKWNSEIACYEVLQLNGDHYSFDVRCAIRPCEVIKNIFDKEVK